MKKLQARNGRKYSFQADKETLQALRHCHQFIERSLEVQVSEGVLLRRAVNLLTAHYDKLQKRLNKGKEIRKDDELFWLERASEPVLFTKVDPIAEGESFMTYADRKERERKKVTLETILRDASRSFDRRHGLHLTPDKMKLKRKGEE